MFYTKEEFLNKLNLPDFKNLKAREQIFYSAIFALPGVAILTFPLSLFIGDYVSVFAEFIAVVISYLLYLTYKKTENLDLLSLVLLWLIAMIIFFVNTFNKYDLDIVLSLFVPLLGGVLLSRRDLIRHGFIFTFTLISFIFFGYITHPEYVLFSNPLFLVSFVTLYTLSLIFAAVYHVFIESAYTKLDQSNKAKEILLQEIHHRVKNNLNMISSILALQCKGQSDESISILQKNRNRIDSIAMVHESLYRSEDFEYIDFKYYTNMLVKHLTFISFKKNVTLNIESNDIILSSISLTSIALLLQELIINSIKYAFNSPVSSISISLRQKENNIYILQYEDSMNEPIDSYHASLGMKIIELKVKEMNGSINLDTSNGFVYTIEFQLIESLDTL